MGSPEILGVEGGKYWRGYQRVIDGQQMVNMRKGKGQRKMEREVYLYCTYHMFGRAEFVRYGWPGHLAH